MREWDFWMWLAYGLLAIAATFLAVDQGINWSRNWQNSFHGLTIKIGGRFHLLLS
jgi:hypothetical protein